jgi:hypothetical protein
LYNKQTNLIRRECKNYKNKRWQNIVDNVNYGNPSTTKYWNSVKHVIGKSKQKVDIKQINHDNNLYSTDSEIANCFGTHFSKIFSESNDDNFDSTWQNKINNLIKNVNLMPTIEDNVNITNNDIYQSIKKAKLNKASGPDHISNNLIKQLPSSFYKHLKKLFELSINNSKMPQQWKHATVILIPKPGKDHLLTSSYRPISLLSCLSKILERIINNKLQTFLEENQIILPEQAGFRQNKSTTDNIVRLNSLIDTTKKQKKSSVLISCLIDIEKCFDKIWLNGLKYKILKLQINRNLRLWLCEFLTNRTFSIKINKVYSKTYDISAGVPQGAILSPTLYILFSSDLPRQEILNNGTEILGYADDFRFTNSAPAKYTFLARKALQNSIDCLTTWSDKWRLKLNPDKCNTIIFANNPKEYYKTIFIHDDPIPKCKEVKFLGITYTSNFNFETHIQNKLKECTSIFNGMKIAKGKRISPHIIIQIYQTYVRSKLLYAATAWYPYTTKTQAIRLEVTQRKAIKLSYNLHPRTSSAQLGNYSKIPPISDFIKNLFERYHRRVQTLNNEILLPHMLHTSTKLDKKILELSQ